MARKRTPSPEQQTSDRSIVAGCAQILGPLAARYPAPLEAAVSLLRTFAASKVEAPAKKFKRVPKNAPVEDRIAAQGFIEQ